MKKIIKDYPNYYIYDNGDVMNMQTQKILKGSVSEHGYKYYRLSKNGEKKMFYAHRLVAEAFIPNPNNYSIVNHKDGNKLNNNIDNLEWVTYSDNTQHWHNDIAKNTNNRKRQIYEADLENETWKEIPEYKNYLVSNYGRVRNLKTNCILRPSLTCGYYKIRCCQDGFSKDFMIHKLVYSVFNNDFFLNEDETIDHIDGDKLNNNLNNLKKVSLSENALNALYIQKTNKNLKPVDQYDLNGNFIKHFESARQASRELKLDSSTISKVCRGINKTHGGFIFKYSPQK